MRTTLALDDVNQDRRTGALRRGTARIVRVLQDPESTLLQVRFHDGTEADARLVSSRGESAAAIGAGGRPLAVLVSWTESGVSSSVLVATPQGPERRALNTATAVGLLVDGVHGVLVVPARRLSNHAPQPLTARPLSPGPPPAVTEPRPMHEEISR